MQNCIKGAFFLFFVFFILIEILGIEIKGGLRSMGIDLLGRDD